MTNKKTEYTTYIFVLCLFLIMQGCLTPYVRYTRPSYRADKKDRTEEIIDTSGKRDTLITRDRKKEIPSADTHKETNFESKLKCIVDSYIGVRYKYGGTTRKGMDCSGFVWRVYTDLGWKNFPRTSSKKLSTIGKSIVRSNMQLGDLIFFRKGRRIDHVGIYMGDNTFSHASTKKGIMYTELDSDYFRNRLVCIRRVHK